MPPPAEPVQVLALLTRIRTERVAAGELAAERLYDVRAFKCCYAELGYLRRLAAAGRAGGTVVTSMRQLVAGLAALHPAWEITDEGFEDRDRHHQAVRRRLADLQAMGLLRWRIGIDLEGEDRRTELELRPPPPLTVDELQSAAGRLERWQARYGPALNTGSKTGIRNAAGHGRPLSVAERQRRGRQRACSVAASRARSGGSKSNSAPPCGAPATPENTIAHQNASEIRDAWQRTRAPAPDTRTQEPTTRPEPPETAVTEVPDAGSHRGATVSPDASVAHFQPAETSGFDPDAIVARVRERQAQRRPVLEAIAQQATARALEVAGWDLQRAWPFTRLREAWVVARYGPTAAVDSGPAGAGPLYPDDYARLRRAVARYQRNAAAAPEGYPATGLGALLHLGALVGAGEIAGGPRTLRYAVGALDQLSRRMRAVATADSALRHQTNINRAQRRRRQPPVRALQLTFRKSRWPAWVHTDHTGDPLFQHGMLQLDYDAPWLPRADSDAYRMTVRDAYLLAGLKLPVDLDGRKQMALRHQRQLDPAHRRPPRTSEQLELAELAHRTGEPIAMLRRLSLAYRQQWLFRQRQHEALRTRTQTLAFREQIADTLNTPSDP